MESKYLDKFKKLESSGNKPLLYGDRLIVEVLPKEELKKGGIIIQSNLNDYRNSTEENRAQLCLILMVGDGYEDEEGNDIPIPYKPGELILVGTHALKLYTQFPGLADFTPNDIAMTRSSEIHMQWDSFEAYESYKTALNN